MNKIIILVLGLTISFTALGQKKELKKIEKKFVNKGDRQNAYNSLKELEPTVKGTEHEAYLSYLYGRNAFGDKKNFNYINAAKFFKKTISLEDKNGNDDYSDKAVSYLNNIHDFYFNKITQAVKNKNFNQSGKFYDVYSKAFPERRDLVFLSLYSYQQAKNEDKMLGLLEKLLKTDTNKVSFGATNKRTKKVDEFFKKADRDLAVKVKTHHTPTDIKVESKTRIEYYSNLVRIYNNKGQDKKTLNTLNRAKKEFPKNAKFFHDFATVTYKSGNKEAYIKALQDVLRLEPKNKDIWFNLAVTHQNLKNVDKAVFAYNKVIEIAPDNRGAYVNKGLTIMSREPSIINQLNQNLNNKKNYNVIKKKLDAMYEKAIPVFEKAYALKKSDGIKGTLINLYNGLGQKEKANALK